VLATGLPSRELCSIWLGIPKKQCSTLYTVITAGEAVEVSYSAIGRAAMV